MDELALWPLFNDDQWLTTSVDSASKPLLAPCQESIVDLCYIYSPGTTTLLCIYKQVCNIGLWTLLSDCVSSCMRISVKCVALQL